MHFFIVILLAACIAIMSVRGAPTTTPSPAPATQDLAQSSPTLSAEEIKCKKNAEELEKVREVDRQINILFLNKKEIDELAKVQKIIREEAPVVIVDEGTKHSEGPQEMSQANDSGDGGSWSPVEGGT